MKPVLLSLAAAATIGAAPYRPPPSRPSSAPVPGRYEAGGFEPSWDLVIENGRLIYDTGMGGVPVLRIPLPRRQPVRNGYRYVSPRLTVDVRHVRCESYNGQTYPDTVTVSGIVEPGCGGVAIPPDELRYTTWEVTSFNGIRAGHDEFTFFFEGDGRLTGHAGCTDFSMPYREQRPLVRFGPMRVTWRGCEGMGREVERRAIRILSGTMRMNFFAGDNLHLTGNEGSLRAQN